MSGHELHYEPEHGTFVIVPTHPLTPGNGEWRGPEATTIELHHGAGQPLLPANAPAPPPHVHATCGPPCDGHGNHIHEDGVTPNACPGPQTATQGANQQ